MRIFLPNSEGQEKKNKQTEADEQTSTQFHKVLPRRHASIPLRTFEVRVDPASFRRPPTPLPLHFAGAPPHYGNTKGRAFWTVCAPAVRARGGAPLPTAQPAHSHSVCSVIRCDTKTSLSSSLCQPAAPHWKPDLTAMTLQPDWTSDPLTSPSHSYGAQAPPLPLLKCRPLDYSINTLPWSQRFFPLASVPASVSNPAPTRKHLLTIIFFFESFLRCIIFLCFDKPLTCY